jgi:hypothetical protein
MPDEERIDARAGEHDQHCGRFEHGEHSESASHHGDAPPGAATGEDERQDDAEQEHEGKGARRECQRGADEGCHTVTSLQQYDRCQEQGHAEHICIEARQKRQRRSYGECARRPARVASPLPRRDRGEQGTRGSRAGHDERCHTEQRRESRSEQAVGDEWIGARVPVVVPEQHAVADE